MTNMPNINAKAIDKVMDKLLYPDTGLTPFAKIDQNGFNTVLELRSRYGGRQLNDPSKYLDLTYYQQAKDQRLSSWKDVQVYSDF